MFRIISVALALVGLVMFSWSCQPERPAVVNNSLPETNAADYAVVLQSPNSTYDQNAVAPISVSIIRDARKSIDSVSVFYLYTTSIPGLAQHVFLDGIRFSFNYGSTLWSCDDVEWDIRNLPSGIYWLYADVYSQGKMLEQKPTIFPFELKWSYFGSDLEWFDHRTITVREL